MAVPGSSNPTHQNRIDAVKQVVYEYANLMAAYHYSMNGKPPWRTNADDGFLLGYRKLRDFLLNDYPRYKDDILALDYLPPGSVRTWDLPTWENKWRDHMNKHLTHIAYARVISPRPREWNHLEWDPPLMKDFLIAWKALLDAATDPQYSAEFKRQIDDCQGKTGFADIPLR